jgi:hypothetical protein
MNKMYILKAMFLVCLLTETSQADDPFIEIKNSKQEKFIPLEEANKDIEQGGNVPLQSELAPADSVAPEIATEKNQEKIKSQIEKKPNFARVERGLLVDKYTLKNGDTVINVKPGADPELALRAALGIKVEQEEVPLRPSEDWTKLP